MTLFIEKKRIALFIFINHKKYNSLLQKTPPYSCKHDQATMSEQKEQ